MPLRQFRSCSTCLSWLRRTNTHPTQDFLGSTLISGSSRLLLQRTQHMPYIIRSTGSMTLKIYNSNHSLDGRINQPSLRPPLENRRHPADESECGDPTANAGLNLTPSEGIERSILRSTYDRKTAYCICGLYHMLRRIIDKHLFSRNPWRTEISMISCARCQRPRIGHGRSSIRGRKTSRPQCQIDSNGGGLQGQPPSK